MHNILRFIDHLYKGLSFSYINSYQKKILTFIQTIEYIFNLFYGYIPKLNSVHIFESNLFESLMIDCIIRSQIFTYM
jgi:hypothetical protein